VRLISPAMRIPEQCPLQAFQRNKGTVGLPSVYHCHYFRSLPPPISPCFKRDSYICLPSYHSYPTFNAPCLRGSEQKPRTYSSNVEKNKKYLHSNSGRVSVGLCPFYSRLFADYFHEECSQSCASPSLLALKQMRSAFRVKTIKLIKH
jgi:hypothetical protein